MTVSAALKPGGASTGQRSCLDPLGTTGRQGIILSRPVEVSEDVMESNTHVGLHVFIHLVCFSAAMPAATTEEKKALFEAGKWKLMECEACAKKEKKKKKKRTSTEFDLQLIGTQKPKRVLGSVPRRSGSR